MVAESKKLSIIIKSSTHASHQKTESIMVRRLKAIRSETDYIRILRGFYAFFYGIEQRISSYVTKEILSDLPQRRNSSHIQKDIEELGGTIDNISIVSLPDVNNVIESLGAFYVLEGSIMGGPYIVQMLKKVGIERGTSFFEGYGTNSQNMWQKFIKILDEYGDTQELQHLATNKANETFQKFGEVFES